MSGFFGGGGGSATTDAGDLTSGVLAHERGGLEADVSAYSGLIKIASGSTSQATAGTDYQAVLTGLADIPGSDKLAEARGGLGSLTGLIKATSGTASAAVAGTDYYAPGGTDVALADGGTGASTAAGARTNLGVPAAAYNERTSATPGAVGSYGVAGSGTNIAGGNLVLAAGAGTGTGASGTVKIQTAPPGSSGSSLNSLVDRYVCLSNGTHEFRSNVAGDRYLNLVPFSTGVTMSLGGGGGTIGIGNNSTGGVTLQCGFSGEEIKLNTIAGDYLRVSATGLGLYGTAPVARSTGWTIPATYTTRKTFSDASTVTLQQLADVVATMISTFGSTSGVGLIAN